jgi:hypothetical protein
LLDASGAAAEEGPPPPLGPPELMLYSTTRRIDSVALRPFVSAKSIKTAESDSADIRIINIKATSLYQQLEYVLWLQLASKTPPYIPCLEPLI